MFYGVYEKEGGEAQLARPGRPAHAGVSGQLSSKELPMKCRTHPVVQHACLRRAGLGPVAAAAV